MSEGAPEERIEHDQALFGKLAVILAIDFLMGTRGVQRSTHLWFSDRISDPDHLA